MNVILFVSDTFRYDSLACYGGGLAQTPRLDAFADRSYVFEKAYLSSFPTVPNRRDIMSGQFSCVHSEWGPLPPDLVVLQQVLSRVGVLSMMIADTPHLLGHGFNYCRGFDGFDWIRGQENDHYRTHPRNVPLPPHPEKWRGQLRENFMYYLRNVAEWEREEDRFAPQTVSTAMDWLEKNGRDGPFFLYVDVFDPHEPWDAPQHYVDLYNPGYEGLEVTYPRYGFWEEYLTPAEMEHVQALYKAEVTMVDHWFGRLLDKVTELGLGEDTAIIFTSDHGILLGEHNFLGKSYGNPAGFETVPLYQQISRIPLLIHLPGQKETERVSAFAQTPDLMPTILELAGVVATETISGQAAIQVLQCGVHGTHQWRLDPSTLHGASLVPLMEGAVERVREIAVSSHTLVHATPTVAKASIVTEDGWCLHYPGHYTRAYEGVASHIQVPLCPVEEARQPAQPMLFYLPDDPGETRDLLHENLPLAREIHEAYVRFLESADTPEAYLGGRRELGVS